MFKVKATVVGFLGNIERYPCHFGHKVGDEVIWDGEKFIGRLCGSVWPALIPKVNALWSAGPRYVEPAYYYPFWYASLSESDPGQKKYDGLGFKNVLKTIVEPPSHLAHLQPPDAFKWPPHGERTIAKDIMVTCPDTRSSMVMKVEAFDLADKGYDIPYFRRQMSILSKVSQKPGINVDKILNEFSKKQIEEIYPPLAPMLVQCLVEELELMAFLEIQNGKASITKKGQKKLEEFKASIPAEERKLLEL
jgi:uncharacterized repeat protein (TIGR04076 family)